MADEPPPLLTRVGLAPPLSIENFPALITKENTDQTSKGNRVSCLHKDPTLISSNSFVEAIKGSHGRTEQAERDPKKSLAEATSIDPDSIRLPPISEHEGKLAIYFPVAQKEIQVDKLKYVLIGKFSHGRPKWSSIKKFFTDIKLTSAYNISVFDNKHIFIECSCNVDFQRLWLRLVWSIDGYSMRMFKWFPDFSPLKESSIAPVWIRMVGLPLHLLDEMSILQVSHIVGKPIKIDARNVNRSMLNQASVCVQLDVNKPLLDTCWIGFINEQTGKIVESHRVKIYYDVLPLYCTCCAHIGHNIEICKRNIKEAGKTTVNAQEAIDFDRDVVVRRPGKDHAVWLPVARKNKVDTQASTSKSDVQNDVSSDNDGSKLQVVEKLQNEQLLEKTPSTMKYIAAASESNNITNRNQFYALNEEVNDISERQNMVHHMKNAKDFDDLEQVQKNISNFEYVAGKEIGQRAAQKVEQQLQVQNVHQISKHAGKIDANCIDVLNCLEEIPPISAASECKITTEVLQIEPAQLDEIAAVAPKQAEPAGCQASLDGDFGMEEAVKDAQTCSNKMGNKDADNRLVLLSIEAGDSLNTGHIITDLAEEKNEKTRSYNEGQQQGNSDNAAANLEVYSKAIVQVPLNVEAASFTPTKIPELALVVLHSGSMDVNEQQQKHHDTTFSSSSYTGTVLIDSCINPEASSTQEWQVVKKKNKTQGVVTRAQAKASNITWADQAENEEDEELPPPYVQTLIKSGISKGVITRSQAKNSNNTCADKVGKEQNEELPDHMVQPKTKALATKAQAGNTTKSRNQLRRKMCKLGDRLNNMGLRHEMRSQLVAELEALQEEYSLLC